MPLPHLLRRFPAPTPALGPEPEPEPEPWWRRMPRPRAPTRWMGQWPRSLPFDCVIPQREEDLMSDYEAAMGGLVLD